MTKTDFHTQLELVINELVADRDHFMSDAEAKAKDVERLNGEVSILQSDKLNLETRLAEQGGRYNTLETEHKNLGTSRDGYKSDAEAKATEVSRLTRERDNHRDNYAALVKCLVDNKLFVGGQTTDDLDTALAAIFREKDELQLAKTTLEQEVSDLNSNIGTLRESNKALLYEKEAAENKYITLENILVEKGIVPKGTKSEDVGSSVDIYVAKVKIKDERISTLEKENDTLGSKSMNLDCFLANVKSIGYDNTNKKLDLFLDEVYRALPQRSDSSVAVVDSLTVSDDLLELPPALPLELPPALSLELPKDVEQPLISLNYVPSDVIKDVQPPSSSFCPNSPVSASPSIVPSLIVSSPLVLSPIVSPNNASGVDRSEDVTPVDKLSKLSYYKNLLNKIPSPLRSPRMLVGAAVLLLGVCYAPYSGYFDNNRKKIVSTQSVERNGQSIQNIPLDKSSPKLFISPINLDVISLNYNSFNNSIDSHNSIDSKVGVYNYTYNQNPGISQFYCPNNMVAGRDTLCRVVVIDDNGVDKCMLTYTLNNRSHITELNSDSSDKTKKSFEFNLTSYCSSQGYPCTAVLDVICYDTGGLQSDKASMMAYVAPSDTLNVKSTSPEASKMVVGDESVEVKKIIPKTACGSKNAMVPVGINLNDWLKYKCRKPEEGEMCYSKGEYTYNGVACFGDRYCCPPLQK